MGIHKASHSPRRAYYPSGPWVDGIKPYTSTEESKPDNPNLDPTNYKIIKVLESEGFLLIKLNYPDCTNYEGNKILLYANTTLVELVNQKVIDPHFNNDPKLKWPIARFVPTDEGWEYGLDLIDAIQLSNAYKQKKSESKHD